MTEEQRNELEKLKGKGTNLLTQSSELITEEEERKILRCEEDKEIAGIFLKEASALEKEIKESYAKIKKPLNEALKATREEEKKYLEIPAKAKKMLSMAIGAFDEKQRKIAAVAAEKERQRLQAIREKEIEKKQEEALRLAEKGKEEESRKAKEEAEEIKEMPEPIVIEKKPEKIPGTRRQRNVCIEIEDELRLKKHIINQIHQGKDWIGLVKVNDSAVRTLVKNLDKLKQKTIDQLKGMFPGAEIWEEFKTISTGK